MLLSTILKSNFNFDNSQKTIPVLEIELLLSSVLNKDRSFILAHPEYELTEKESSKLKRLIKRRQNHEPIAYILGYKEFYGLEFKVTKDTLIPRPETEGLVDLSVEYITKILNPNIKPPTSGLNHKLVQDSIQRSIQKTTSHQKLSQDSALESYPRDQMNISNSQNLGITNTSWKLKADSSKLINILDIGTGTGCIPISILYALRSKQLNKFVQIFSIDKSTKALGIAEENINRYHLNNSIKLLKVDVTNKTQTQKLGNTIFDIVISNPPYIPDDDVNSLDDDVKNFEPKVALKGGKSGLKIYKAIMENLVNNTNPETVYLFEVNESKALEVKTLARLSFPKKEVRLLKDSFGEYRYLEIV